MEKTSHSYDALTGIETVTGLDPVTNRFVVRHRANITPNIEYAKAIANDDDVWKTGVKRGFAMAGHIPDITIVELRQIGVDIFTATLPEIRAGLRTLGKEGFLWKS